MTAFAATSRSGGYLFPRRAAGTARRGLGRWHVSFALALVFGYEFAFAFVLGSAGVRGV